MSNQSTTAPSLGLGAPGPGPWELDAMHMPRPVTRVLAAALPEAIKAAHRASLPRYGTLLDFVEFRFTGGFAYFRPRPVGAPASASAPPPRAVWKLLTTFHPEIRRRLRAARDVFERRPWREDLAAWDAEVKPTAIAAHLALQSVDLGALSDDGLAAHIGRVHAHALAMLRQHHAFDAAALMPVGDFLAHAHAFTGRPRAELLHLLTGGAPVSAGEMAELPPLVAALRADAAARAAFEAAPPEQAIARLAARGGEVGAAVDRLWQTVAFRLADGIDPGQATIREVPHLLAARVRAALDARVAPHDQDRERDTESDVRAAVPAADRALFDALLAEARRMARLRDERGVYSDIWGWGIFRTAVLEAGRRLAGKGALATAAHLLDGSLAEIVALTRGQPGPAADTLAARARYRAEHDARFAPASFGKPPAPPPFDFMPPASARLDRAIFTYVRAMFDEDRPTSAPATQVRGLAASPGKYVGTARVLAGPHELHRLRPGDVLVTPSTSAAFNVALPLVGAIVTDRGGVLCHAAIVARECGIPGVVGCREATRLLPDGARVLVDGSAGEASVLNLA